MPFESEVDAAQQLFESVLEDGTARSDEQEMHTLVEQAREGKNADVEGADQGATEPDTFTRIDPSTLPEELLPIYHSMQGDYTRKTQEVAQERKAFEALEEYGGVDTALEALTFANNLATDPNYAMQVHAQLSEALTEAGLTPAQASQEAARQVNEAASQASQSDDFAFGDDDGSDPQVKALEQKLSGYEQELQQMQAWRQEQEERAFNMQLANDMARQENAILTAHPEYLEDDMEKIYTLSYAYGGNLEQANQVYEKIRQETISDYIAKKGATSTQSIQGTGITSAEEPVRFTDLYDKNLTRLVNERLAQELAAE